MENNAIFPLWKAAGEQSDQFYLPAVRGVVNGMAGLDCVLAAYAEVRECALLPPISTVACKHELCSGRQ